MINYNNIGLAVLPFMNMSSDVENEYFSDGITEEILNALAKIEGLRVTARTSSFMFKGRNEDIREIGKQLGVDVIIEGSVRKAGNRVRITAQLINVSDGFHFWSESYDRNLTDIFAVQDEISLIIAEKIREYMGHFDIQDKLIEESTHNLEAYNLYMKGRFHCNLFSPEGISKAIQYFENALAIDSEYPMPNLGLAEAYSFLAGAGYVMPDEAFAKARKYAERAIELNPLLCEPYIILGVISFYGEWNFRKAQEYLYKAIGNHPNNAEARKNLSMVLFADNCIDEAKEQILLAMQIDPISVQNKMYYAALLLHTNKIEEALEIYETLLNNNPTFGPLITNYALVLALVDRNDEALELLLNIPPNESGVHPELGLLGYVYARMGNHERATEIVEVLSAAVQKREEWAIKAGGELINMLIALERYDEAIDVIEEGLQLKAPGLIFIKVHIMYEPLRQFARFKKATEIIISGGLPESEEKKEKYTRSRINEATAKEMCARLESYMTKEKPYLNNELGLKGLADKLNVSANQLSQLLNERFEKNFYDFINTYRLEEFIRRWSDPKNREFTILSVAFDCGFNAKTTFNTFFKKATGKTPTEYFK